MEVGKTHLIRGMEEAHTGGNMPITYITRICENCGGELKIKPCRVKTGRGRFCSKSCAKTGKNGSKYKHGMLGTKEYNTWVNAKGRVAGYSPLSHKHYLDKGIKMSEEWSKSFESFYRDMGPAPSPKHEIDRIDNSGDYCKENCRWADKSTQMNNTSQNKLITYKGVTMTQEQWGRKVGLSGSIIYQRLSRGWTLEKTLTTPKMVFSHGRWY